MKKTSQLLIAIAICFVFVSFTSSSNSDRKHSETDQITFESNSTTNQITAEKTSGMDQITAEMFEPYLEKYAKQFCLDDFKKNERWRVKSCTRMSSIIIQDKVDNKGKYGYCNFRINLQKQKNVPKIRKRPYKDMGYVDMYIKGIIEIRSDGGLQFVPIEYKYDKIKVKGLTNEEIKEGVIFVIKNVVPVVIKIATSK